MEYLAIIEPLEDIKDKNECRCGVYFLTGDKKGFQREMTLRTGIFTYYFYGAAIEVIEMDYEQVRDVRDIKQPDIRKFDLGLSYALTFNSSTQEILATNGFVYKFDQSTFYRRYPYVVSAMYQNMMTGLPFVWQLYTINGALVYVEMLTGFKKDSPAAKYALASGFVVSDRNTLKCMLPKTETEFEDSNKKLSQDEIDRLITKFNR